MNQKNSKQYKTYLKRCSDDDLLKDFYLHIQSKEEIKKQILESLTINISGDHSLFTREIRQGIEEIAKKIGEKISRDGVFNPLENFDYTHEKYLLIAGKKTRVIQHTDC